MTEVHTELRKRYLHRLERWPAAMRDHLYVLPADPDAACMGPGDHGHWSMQANNTAAAAFAVLAVDPQTDFARVGMSRDEMLAWALRMIRFNLRSHHAGGKAATDLQSWGHSWISVLCLERLGHAVDALGEMLPEEDRQLLHRVYVSESDWLLDHYEIVAGLVDNNKPESNIWNGCMLHRTARQVPDAPRRQEYLEKGTQFLLNGISTPADAESAEIVAGRPLADWHVGANMYDNMACNHHRYLNVGYMGICLSNIAMMHFSCRANGWSVPEGLYHHARELWQLVKTCTFADGRLWRIGGDTRVRYCYCQDYAIPMWLLARDVWDDGSVDRFEHGWLDILGREARYTDDDTFLAARLTPLERVSPIYYVRLEGDRAVSLSMGAYYHRLLEQIGTAPASQQPVPVLRGWSDDYHGSLLARGEHRLASWTWRAASPPQGMCLPPEASSMGEWQGNLCPRICGLGAFNEARCGPRHHELFDGGFATCGRVVVHSHQPISEGEAAQDVAAIDLAFVALPDDRTCVVIQRAQTLGRVWLPEVKGLFYQMPNDVFNDMTRCYADEGGAVELRGCPGQAEARSFDGQWLNVDGRLSIVRVYGPPLTVHRPAERQIFIKPYTNRQHTDKAGGNLYVDEICLGGSDQRQAFDAGETLVDIGAVLLSGVAADETAAYVGAAAPTRIVCEQPDQRGVQVIGADGKSYRVVADFGATRVQLEAD